MEAVNEEEMALLAEPPDVEGLAPAGHPSWGCSSSSEVRHRGPKSPVAGPQVAPGGRTPSFTTWMEESPEPLELTEVPLYEPRPSPDDELHEGGLHSFWHRCCWLVLLLMFQSTSSAVLEHFQILIQKHPVVIYFLTMLVGAGGNAGGQSTVLIVRKLALSVRKNGVRGAGFSLRRIVGGEVWIGARLALVLFAASFVRCVAFQVRGVECLAICISMCAIVFTSTILGALLPLLLDRLKFDPAHAGAAIQVVMDISGVTLTCVVSCLVLGLPLGGTDPNATVAAVAAQPVHIQHAGLLHGLHAFGKVAGVGP